jgi:hypothetical protein
MDEFENLNPITDIIDHEEEARIFSEIAKIDGVAKYFRSLMAQDMRLHFETDKNSQDLIRGAYFRTKHFAKLLKTNSLKDLTKK